MAFKMKAGKEGPMKKNFPSAFKGPHEFLVAGAGSAAETGHMDDVIESTMRTNTLKEVGEDFTKGKEKIIKFAKGLIGAGG
jgi:hypothetical protein